MAALDAGRTFRRLLRGAFAFAGMLAFSVAQGADVPVHLSDLYATLDEVAPHVRAYPPKFSSPEEREQVESRLKNLLKTTDKILERYPDNLEILYVRGAGNAMGHELDFPGAAENAIASFERLLAIDPSNRRAAYFYAVFLSRTTLLDKAVVYCKKAIELGVEQAHYTLAVTYVEKGDVQKAQPELEAFLKFEPNNASAQQMLAEMKAGTFTRHVVVHHGPGN